MTKRLSSTQRRASILAVAKVLFADKGYHGVSVDDIARRLGVSPAVLYQHFPSKQALYEAVLNDIACTREHYVDAIVNSELDFRDVLLHMTRVFVHNIARDPDYLRMEMLAALEASPAAKQFFEYRWRAFTDYIEFALNKAARTGHTPSVHPRIASLMFQGMVREALYAKCIYDAEHYRQFALDDLVEHLIGLFINALGHTPPVA